MVPLRLNVVQGIVPCTFENGFKRCLESLSQNDTVPSDLNYILYCEYIYFLYLYPFPLIDYLHIGKNTYPAVEKVP